MLDWVMAQWLREHVAIPNNLSLVPALMLWLTAIQNLRFPVSGPPTPFYFLKDVHITTQEKHL